MAKDRKWLLADYVRMKIGAKPTETSKTHMTEDDESVTSKVQNQGDFISYSYNQLSQLRALATDRKGQYDSFDEISQDSTIAAALELYADDATQSDEQGRVIWVESEDETITKAANRLLDIMEIPERAWKHIYMACKYGDFYLKLYRKLPDTDENLRRSSSSIKVVNDVKNKKNPNPYQEYVEDVNDPATLFELRVKGKTAGYVVIPQDPTNKSSNLLASVTSYSMSANEIKIYPPDRFVHVMVSDNPSRVTEEMAIQFSEDETVTYQIARGKSTLADVYGIQKQLSLLEDTLALTRLVKSPLIRLLEIEVGDMPKNEVNPYLRRFKQLIEQHISLDKTDGDYHSYSAPGPIDNLILVPVKNGKGASNVNTLGGDVNVRDIADIEYYSNKRAGALKIPRSYLGDSSEGSAFDNGGTLTRLSIRYARTIKRIQRAYIRAITQMLNLFFLDMGLDYIGKFEVKMTSPSTQEDLERNELIGNNVDLISSIMDMTSSLEGNTQKKILTHLVSNVLKMPEIATIIKEDTTPEEEIDIEGSDTSVGGSSDLSTPDMGGSSETTDATAVFSGESSDSSSGSDTEFSDAEYDSFQDEM